MCGITGYIDFGQRTLPGTIEKMLGTILHRGPDDMGSQQFDGSNVTIGMGQTRLSIIDLSEAGHQPMNYKELCIVFNGEIYNYKEIRKELESIGHHFHSNSDTEVILHAYDCWGEEFVNKLIGMFVIAIYDKHKRSFLIFRDRAGVKPLFYYWHEGLFIFGSELKSLLAHPSFAKEIDGNTVPLYFDFGYIPAPHTIFKHTFKLEPGKYLTVNLAGRDLSLSDFWNVDSFYAQPKLKISYSEAKEQVHDLLISSCNYRMVSDVPVGIFLSGGYDSSLVTSILQKDRTEKLKTFTIGFQEGNNEAPYAKQIAHFLGTEHTEFICTTKEAQNIIPDLPYYFDEPFADSSAIPTILVSRVARTKVKVALSADAGDELFAGYTDYYKLDRHATILSKIPHQLNPIIKPSLSILSGLLNTGRPVTSHKLLSIAKALNRNRKLQATHLRKMASSLPEFYRQRLFNYVASDYKTKFDSDFSSFESILDIALAIDYGMYLQNDILVKVDRATMSVSLEGREPLLDHRLAEFVIQLPDEFKYNKHQGKIILKDIVHDYIPKHLIDRPKAGFSVPIYKWLRGDLSFLIDEFLNEKAINESCLFNYEFVSFMVREFRNDKFYYKPIIWKLLMFQMWFSRWMK